VRIAILSDIHGNLEALEAVLAEAKSRGYDHLVCLGDVVGYGADPQACVDRIREEVWRDIGGEYIVKGNHDDAASGGDDTYFNKDAQRAVRWTHDQLRPESVEWLANLPMERTIGPDVYLVHASPDDPGAWNYVVNLSDAFVAFHNFSEKICFIGHSHVPFHVFVNGQESEIHIEPSETLELKEGFRYLSNVGSVGQPRDGDPRGSYVILDRERGILERFRVEYDVERAASKILAAGLPEFLANRLSRGR